MIRNPERREIVPTASEVLKPLNIRKEAQRVAVVKVT